MATNFLRRWPIASRLTLFAATFASVGIGIAASWPTDRWAPASPATLGIDERQLSDLSADFAADKYPLIDSLLILRCGRSVYQRKYSHDYATIFAKEAHTSSPLTAHLSGRFNYFDSSSYPYHDRTQLHSLQSVTKSVTSATLGVAITRGDFRASIDVPVLKYFDSAKVRNVDARKRRMTLRHLLTMSAGFDWTEDVSYDDPRNSEILMENSRDWASFVADRPMAAEPGSTFVYNSGATELIAHIFEKETGQELGRYAQEYLFAPLGIRDSYWRRTPKGIVDAVGGLFLRDEDLARIGYLYLHNGLWNGRQVVSTEWVRESLTPVFDAGEGWKYGLQWWIRGDGRSADRAFAARGWGMQRLIVYPDRDLILVLTGWNIPIGSQATEPDAMRRTLASANPQGCGSKPQ